MPGSKKEPRWEIYFEELYLQASVTVKACDELFTLYPPVPDKTVVGGGDGVHLLAARAMNAAVNISKLLTTQKRKDYRGSPKVYAIHQERVKRLLAELSDIPLNELKARKARNSIEHIDENLDELNSKIEDGEVNGVVHNMCMSRLGAVVGWDHHVRLYIGNEKAYYNCGTRIDLAKVREECAAILQRLDERMPGIKRAANSSSLTSFGTVETRREILE
jgi:hypothetical protein